MKIPKDKRSPSSAKALHLLIRDRFRPKLAKEDIALFYRELAILMAEGVSFSEALDVFNAGYKNRMSYVTRGIAERAEMGIPLREGMQKYPSVFNRMLIEILLNEEHCASASTILNHMADEKDKQGEIRKMISRTFLYPAFIFIFLFLLSLINSVFVIPVYEETFSNLGTGLPILTQKYIAIVNWTAENTIYIAIGTVLLYLILKTSSILRTFAKVIISRLPIVGKILRRRTILNFSKSLSVLLSSTISFVDALRYSADAVEGRILSEKIRQMVNKIRSKEDLLENMKQSAIFPSSCLQILYIGERRNSLDDAWHLMTLYFEKRVESSLFRSLTFFRGFSIILLGLVVGYMVLSLYLPVFLTSGLHFH